MNPEVASENPSSLGDKTYWNNVTCSSERLTNSNYTAEINCSQPSESWIDLLSSVAREVTDHKAKRRRIRSDDGYSSESNTSETESEMNGTSRPWISQASQTPIAVYHGSTEQNTSERIITETNKKIMSEDEHVRPGVAFAEDLSWDTPSLNTEESSTPVYYPPPDGQKPLNESLTDYTESFEVSADEIAAAIHTSADTPSATSSEALLNHFVDVASQMARSSSKHQFPADADAISSSFTTAAVAAAAAGALLGFDTVDSSADILKSNIFNTLDIWDKAKENLKLFGLTLPPLKKSPSNSNSEEIHTELISKEGAQKSPSTDISEGSDVNRTKTNNSEDTPTPECQENALSALQPHLDFLSEGFKADDGQWYRRPDISEECLNDLCDLTELKGRISPGTKIEYTYTKGISFALGEGGRELLRACLNAKGCKGRQLQGASVPMLLQLAHEWRLWNIALRIKVERVTGSLCPKHEAFVRFKAVQQYGFRYSELRNATVPQLLKMAYICCMWNEVIDACKKQEAKRESKPKRESYVSSK